MTAHPRRIVTSNHKRQRRRLTSSSPRVH